VKGWTLILAGGLLLDSVIYLVGAYAGWFVGAVAAIGLALVVAGIVRVRAEGSQEQAARVESPGDACNHQ
jgi:hypothetical protein